MISTWVTFSEITSIAGVTWESQHPKSLKKLLFFVWFCFSMIPIWARVLKDVNNCFSEITSIVGVTHFLDIFVQLLYATYACKQHRLVMHRIAKIVQQLAFYPNPRINAGGIMPPVIMLATLGAT
jgi:hypothetical protein